jgi:hypothetical protein
LGNRGDLPQGFAKPAGIGDIAIAVSAAALLFVLGRDNALGRPDAAAVGRRAYHTRLLSAWNILGLIDIIFVAFSALRFGLKDWQAMAALRELPLSLLPTFIVPLIIVSHLLSLLDIFVPERGMFGDELLHHLDAFRQIEIYHFHTVTAHEVERARKRAALAHDGFLDSELNDRARAQVARH